MIDTYRESMQHSITKVKGLQLPTQDGHMLALEVYNKIMP
jgi:hypothetical protein